MTAKYHQISFNDIFSDCQNKLIDDSPSFFYMLSEHVNLNEFIPPKFQSALYLSVGRTHIYPLHDFHFSKVLIPYNPRNESSLKKDGYNAYCYPTCPKAHYHHSWVCDCDKPCNSAKNGRTTYTYENMDLRMFPGIQRDTKE